MASWGCARAPTYLVEAYMRSKAVKVQLHSFHSPGLMASAPHYSITMPPPNYQVKNKIVYLEELLWQAQ